MIIRVASKNQEKVKAVSETIMNYDFIKDAEVNSKEVSSEVSEQPKSMEETIQGALNRAKNVCEDCDLSFGLEDGLIEVPKTQSGFMNICACAIYDGKKFHLGLSSAFEYPPEVTRLVFEKGYDINEAY